MKALEIYRSKNGSYPPTNMTKAATCAAHNNGYNFSDATDGTWLKPLLTDGIIAKAPAPFPNDCSSYYSYLNPGPTSYNCPSRTSEYYVLTVVGIDNSQDAPAGSAVATWRPCAGATAGWGNGPTVWHFIKEA